ncbi:MAG: hypothetical protein LBT64_00415 [Puniceicoccales bacterium]|nr:hypothetical protein [Puniceicoccales bacterium]
MQKKVRVYADDGVSRVCLPHVLHMFGDWDVSTIDAAAIIDGAWMSDADVICIPGGASIPYARKLNGTGNGNIREFVAAGGAYFGICAGAYYGANRIEFDRGKPSEIIGEHELKFFSGSAIGPAFGQFDGRTYRHVTFSDNILSLGNGDRRVNLMFYGGPYFDGIKSGDGFSVLATYAETGQPSIIHGKCGSGTVILSGAHLSIDEKLFTANTNRHLRTLAVPLSATANVRRMLMENIFAML